jgi:hypothetical protein
MAAVVGISLVAALAGCNGGTPPEPKGVPGYYPGVNVQRKQAERQAAAQNKGQGKMTGGN